MDGVDTIVGHERTPHVAPLRVTVPRTVLLVAAQDDIATMRTLVGSLAGDRWKVVAASCVSDAERVVAQAKPAVALIDLGLAESDAVLRLIVDRAPACTVIVERRNGTSASTVDLVRRLASF